VKIMDYGSPQEEFWAGEFGNSYISRNEASWLLSSNINFFSQVFSSLDSLPSTFLELGANVGMNIKALQQLNADGVYTGIEINNQACIALRETGCKVVNQSILKAEIPELFDFVFSKGVLIHLDPNQLSNVYKKMYEWSRRFIVIAEYYNPNPIKIDYRGHSDKLFKRDFAGEMMDLYPNLTLRDYGFIYHRGKFPQDDITWFLLEKG